MNTGICLLSLMLGCFSLSRAQVSLVYQDTLEVTSYQDFSLPVTLQTGHDISAISLGFVFPQEYLEVTGMMMSNGFQGYSYNVVDSLIQMVWSSVEPVTLEDNEAFVWLAFKAKDLQNLTGTIKLELSNNCEFADDSAHVITPLTLVIPVIGLPLPLDTLKEYVKVYPNPFRDMTKIEFYLENESAVKIGVCNAIGEYLGKIQEDVFPKGLHQVSLSTTYLRKGVYFLKFERDNGITSNSRMIQIIAYP